MAQQMAVQITFSLVVFLTLTLILPLLIKYFINLLKTRLEIINDSISVTILIKFKSPFNVIRILYHLLDIIIVILF